METAEKVQVAEHMARAWTRSRRLDPRRLLPGEKAPRVITREPRPWGFSTWDPNLVSICAVLGGIVCPLGLLMIGLLCWLGALGSLGSIFDDPSLAIGGFFGLLFLGLIPLLMGAGLLYAGILAFQRTNSFQDVETAPDDARTAATIVTSAGFILGVILAVCTGAILLVFAGVALGLLGAIDR